MAGDGYKQGTPYNTLPTNAQLDRLTHVMVSDLYPDANGYLRTVHMFNRNINTIWNGNDIDQWLDSLVIRAHQRGVKVSIVISEGKNFKHLSSATQDGTKRQNLVNQIANFVTKHNLDGVDIDWECPGLDAAWNSLDSVVQVQE